jgi:deoxyribose-phosphate aldolase
MVINIGHLKAGLDAEVQKEIAQVKRACTKKHILKVIVETCYLDEDQITRVTKLVDAAGADFIKTSTGFGPRGASFRDIELFK